MARRRAIGGSMLGALFGSGLLAWFITTFFIAPFIGLVGYNFNLLTVLGGILTFQTPSIVFIVLWAAVYLGYFTATYHRR